MNGIHKKIQHTLTIPESFAGQRLDHALAKLLTDYSRTQIKSWIDAGNLLVNGVSVKGKTKVKGSEVITLIAELASHATHQAENFPVPIVYEDEHILVVNKPAGLIVHPGAGNTSRTLLNALLHLCPSLALLPRAGILHRLDKNTSGLLIVAKTSQSLQHLSRQLKKRLITREYQALVYGHLISGGKVEASIGRHPQHRLKMAVTPTGKTAITHYRVVEKYRHITRLKLRLETGRTHQIRVHMAYVHHPIVGDIIYGGRTLLCKGMSQTAIESLRQFKRQALHAWRLQFQHPVTEQILTFESELPEDLQKIIKVLKTDLTSQGK